MFEGWVVLFLFFVHADGMKFSDLSGILSSRKTLVRSTMNMVQRGRWLPYNNCLYVLDLCSIRILWDLERSNENSPLSFSVIEEGLL